MDKNTKNIVFYIVMTFLSVTVVLFVFFGYKVFFGHNNIKVWDLDLSNLADTLQKQKDKEEEAKKKFDTETTLNCLFNDTEIKSGERMFFYIRPSVSAFESCDDFKQAKTCNDGEWFGDPRYKFTSCEKTIDCKLDEDTLVKNGESITLYSRQSVPYGDTCIRYKKDLRCRESVLIGGADYKYKTCEVNTDNICEISGITLGNGQSRTFFLRSEVPYGEICGGDNMLKRTCEFGELNGDKTFKELKCAIKQPHSCFLDGVEVIHGGGRIFYSKTRAEGGHSCNFFAYFGTDGNGRVCDNGILSGMEEYKHAVCIN